MIKKISLEDKLVIDYKDGFSLHIHTAINQKNREEIHSLYLYRKGSYECMISRKIESLSSEEKVDLLRSKKSIQHNGENWSFLTNGVSQRELADYIKEATDYSKDFVATDFWNIMTKCVYLLGLLKTNLMEEG